MLFHRPFSALLSVLASLALAGTALAADLTALGAPGLDAATRWLGTVEVEAVRWGAAPTPFPGLA